MITNNIELMQNLYDVYDNEIVQYNVQLSLTAVELIKTNINNGTTTIVDKVDLRLQNGQGIRDALLHFYYKHGLKKGVIDVATSIVTHFDGLDY